MKKTIACFGGSRLAILVALASLSLGGCSLLRDEPVSVEALVRMTISPSTYDAMLEQVTDQVATSMRAGQTDRTELRLLMKKVMPYEDIVEWSTEIYENHYTSKDVRALKEFYESPVGKKSIALLPSITAEVMKKVSTNVTERLQRELAQGGSR